MSIINHTNACMVNELGKDQDWSRFSQWIHCMCVVTFDLNLGQALEFVYPPQFTPTDREVSNICYMAFPDSNSGCMGDTKFHIRLRISPDLKRSEIHMNRYNQYNSNCLPLLRADESHYWGFVYFRQKRDANLPRGYFQKSFILVTRLPFFNFFYNLLIQLAPKYFEEGTKMIEQCCKQIAREWPQLQAGVTLNLPLFNTNYQTLIPKLANGKINLTTELASTAQNININALSTKVISTVHELDLFRSLEFVVENIYTLWELVLIAEPLVVVGTSPSDCSHMVQSLLALIAPLEYCAESRPYFTIHDSEFREFTRESGKFPHSILLGVTNPFFIKLLKDWPHILKLVDNQINIQQQQLLIQKNIRNTNGVTSFNEVNNLSFIKNFNSSSNMSLSSASGNASSDGSGTGLHTKYKSFLKKDKSLIKKVLLGIKTKRPTHVQTALLRRHLLELTQSFMIPLERYIASLMPLQKHISPFKSAPNANAFKLDDFLSTLELSGPHLTSQLKGDWKGLYKRFFNSPNFRGWYDTRQREQQLTLQDLQLQALSEANLEHWARDKQEVEIIDMILKLKQKLNRYTENHLPDKECLRNVKSSETQEQIQVQINCMKELLPHDLKNVVNI